MSLAGTAVQVGVGMGAAEEARRAKFVFCLFAAAFITATLTFFANSVLQDPDNWWHVKVGLDMLSSGTLPTVDTYSHTFAGQPWIAKEWLGQILLALAYKVGGWNGVALLTIAAVALTVFLIARYLSVELKPVLAVGLTLVLAFVVGPNFNARPFILTFPIIVIWTAELFDAARNERAPSLWLLPLLCLWANLHAAFTFGFVIAFFAGLDLLARVRLSKPRLAARWMVFGLLCPLVTLLNPHGVKAIIATFAMANGNEAVPYIEEWQAFNAAEDVLQEVALLAMVFGLLVSRVRIGWVKAVFFLFLLHLLLAHIRFMYLFFMLVPIVVAVDVAQQYPLLSTRQWAAAARDGLEQFVARHFHGVSAAIAASLALIAAIFIAVPRIAPSQETSAEGALAFASEHNLSGNVMNSYAFGGTLIFHGIKTYIDGRNDQLFLGGFTKRDHDMGTSAGKPVLEEQLKEHAIDWALLEVNDNRVPFFDQLPDWRRAYADDYAVIYMRGD